MDLDRRERLYLSAWATGAVFLVTTFAALTMASAYRPGELAGVVLWTNIVLGIGASQPPLYAYMKRRRGADHDDRADTIALAAGAGIVLTVPAWSVLDVGADLWLTAVTLAAGVLTIRLVRQASGDGG
jgi:hypothetical protein